MQRIVRHSSTIAHLWIKHNGNLPVKVSTSGCTDISDFVKEIKKELSPKLNSYSRDQITIHKTLTDAALEPDLLLSNVSTAGLSAKSPLIVKHQESTTTEKIIFIQDIDGECRPLDSFTEVVVETEDDLMQIFEGKCLALYLLSNPKKRVTKVKQLIDGEKYKVNSIFEAPNPKTIFIQDIDEKCRPLDSFTEVDIETDDDLKQIFEGKGSALYLLSNPKKRVTSMTQLIHGEKYNVFSRYEKSFVDEYRWKQMEDKAMEQETYIAVKRYLATHLGSSIEDMATDIMGSDGKTVVQEWDAVFKDGDVLYLCVAKHNMTLKQVNKLHERIRKFKEFQVNAQPEFRSVTKYVGVLCGALFPEDIRNNAHMFGYICVYPSGNCYDVKKLENFIIER
jgi:hypothetical protein